ncbi:MAG TPA: hypothetical protein VH328_15945, partial [Burkholderiaceae bacterium]|nr:hypothetical protein [Burkholderiaceae bacterium]
MPSAHAHAHSWIPTFVRARPRLVIVFTLAVFTGIFLPTQWAHALLTRWLVAWNVGTCLYVCIAAVMMTRSTPQHMRRR